MDPGWAACEQAGIVIAMTLVGFICGLGANLEHIGRIARWKAQLESGRPGDQETRS